MALGKPTEKKYLENFSGKLQDESLNANWFVSSAGAGERIKAWGRDAHQGRLHIVLRYQTPEPIAA